MSDIETTLKQIVATVGERTKCKVDDILSKSRKRDLTFCRQACWYIANSKCESHPADIAKFFNVHRTTVLNGLKTFKDLVDAYERVACFVALVVEDLSL